LQLQSSASFKSSWAADTTLSLLWVISGLVGLRGKKRPLYP
jgi:hypothetical protein